jgi:formamidopyrimidine-DNA glycosylase
MKLHIFFNLYVIKKNSRFYSNSLLKKIPEGPEVRGFVDYFDDRMFKRDIDDMWYLHELKLLKWRYSKKPPEGYTEMVNNLLPSLFRSVGSKGKFLYFRFDNFSIWCTLGIQGYYEILESSEPPPTNNKHLRSFFVFKSSKTLKTLQLLYYDAIGFGTIRISTDEKELESKLKSLGPCWVTNPPRLNEFVKMGMETRLERYVARFLMDQSKTSGIGNYILSEVFYMARIHPWAECGSLVDKDWRTLYFNILKVVETSYKLQSISSLTTRRSYDNSNNQKFEFKVYGKTTSPSGHKVIKEMGPHKLFIYWVPEVQFLGLRE